MAYVFLVILIASIVGLARPYKSFPAGKRWHYGVAALVSFFLIGITAPKPENGANPEPANSPSSSASAVTAEPAATVPDVAQPTQSAWTYAESKDEMRGGLEKTADVDADEVIKLDFPYGEQRPFIRLRKSPRFGFDVMFGVPSGQILCNSFSNSHISVKFDNGPIQRFECTDASDGTSDVVFITNRKGFLEKLRSSKRTMIEAEFYQNGMQQSSFNTGNLVWE